MIHLLQTNHSLQLQLSTLHLFQLTTTISFSTMKAATTMTTTPKTAEMIATTTITTIIINIIIRFHLKIARAAHLNKSPNQMVSIYVLTLGMRPVVSSFKNALDFLKSSQYFTGYFTNY